jgi:hypothetical protein
VKRVIYGSPYPTKWLPIFHQAAAARDKVKAYNSEYVVFYSRGSQNGLNMHMGGDRFGAGQIKHPNWGSERCLSDALPVVNFHAPDSLSRSDGKRPKMESHPLYTRCSISEKD